MDVTHAASCWETREHFVPLVVETLGGWSAEGVRPLHGLAISFSSELGQAGVLGTFSVVSNYSMER